MSDKVKMQEPFLRVRVTRRPSRRDVNFRLFFPNERFQINNVNQQAGEAAEGIKELRVLAGLIKKRGGSAEGLEKTCAEYEKVRSSCMVDLEPDQGSTQLKLLNKAIIYGVKLHKKELRILDRPFEEQRNTSKEKAEKSWQECLEVYNQEKPYLKSFVMNMEAQQKAYEAALNERDIEAQIKLFDHVAYTCVSLRSKLQSGAEDGKELEEVATAVEFYKTAISKSEDLLKANVELEKAWEKLGSGPRRIGVRFIPEMRQWADEASVVYEAIKKIQVAKAVGVSSGEKTEESEKNLNLDKLVTQLGDEEDLETQTTLRAAISLRYEVEFPTSGEFTNPLGTGIKKLGSLYKILGLVPPLHLTAKTGTMQLSYKEEPRVKQHKIQMGAAGTFDQANKFAKRDDDQVSTMVLTLPTDGKSLKRTRAKGDGTGETESDFFKAVAVHEVGHAADDQVGYMKAHAKDGDHGNWLPSSENEVVGKYVGVLTKIAGSNAATAVEAFVRACLEKDVPTKPEDDKQPLSGLVPFWDQLVPVGTIITGLRQGKALWYKGAAAAKAAAGAIGEDRVYFEAYPGQWWSFALAARSKSVAEYQWRAPGEWFAEAYSLFSTGQLPSDHPVYAFCDGKVKVEN